MLCPKCFVCATRSCEACVRTTQSRLNRRIVLATQRFLGTFLRGSRTSNVNIGRKLGRVGKNRYVVWTYLNESTMNCEVLNCASSEVDPCVAFYQRTKKRDMSRQESNFATIECASDDLFGLT